MRKPAFPTGRFGYETMYRDGKTRRSTVSETFTDDEWKDDAMPTRLAWCGFKLEIPQ